MKLEDAFAAMAEAMSEPFNLGPTEAVYVRGDDGGIYVELRSTEHGNVVGAMSVAAWESLKGPTYDAPGLLAPGRTKPVKQKRQRGSNGKRRR